jgi:hypothetical protein
MEAATVAEPEVEGPAEQEATATNAVPSKMFKFAEWVHVGEGASDCEYVVGEDNERHQGQGCEDEEHFHAFCRLPNQFQHRDIVEKATAAKARRIRLLNDRESDAFEVLDSTLRMIAATEDREIVIDELLGSTWQADYLDALTQVEEDERFEHIDQDRQELNRQRELPENERAGEALDALEKQMEDYVDATRTKLDEVQAPRRTAFEGMALDDLMKLLREHRVNADSDEEYHSVFARWEWLVGTRAPDRRTPKFASLRDMTEDAAPEVIERLQTTFDGLRLAMQRGGRGNS